MHRWLEWAQEMQAIAQAGLTYSKDVFDIERFEQLRRLSVEIMSTYSETPMETVTELFAQDTGYPTPKVDIRGVVFRENKILMVREKSDGNWALPGGWADIGESPGEVAVKETREESGYHVMATKLLAVLDRNKHPHPPHPNYIYKVFIQCEIIGGEAVGGTETDDVGFFDVNELPGLSVCRNTEAQIREMFAFLENPAKEPLFD